MNTTIPQNGVLMSIDYGTRKTGLAISDSQQTFALPLGVIHTQSPLQVIIKKLQEYNVVGCIVGWPLNANGTKGQQCMITEEFTKQLLKYCNLPIIYQDERFSSIYTTLTYNQNDDSITAMTILNEFLETRIQQIHRE